MKRNLLFLIIVTFHTIGFAHQDQFYEFDFDNITVRIKTGFLYEEIENVKIIGQYASNLCDSVDYREPIILDFIHDYGHTYQGKVKSFLNYGSSTYHEVVSFDDKREKYPVSWKKDKKSIVVRQFGFHFSIKRTLNLLFTAINSKAALKKNARTDSLHSYMLNMYYSLVSIPQHDIQLLVDSSNDIVNKLLTQKVYRSHDTINVHSMYHSYYSINDKYVVYSTFNKKERVLDTLDQISFFKQIIDFGQTLFVFPSAQEFKCYRDKAYSENFFKSTLHMLPTENYDLVRSVSVKFLDADIYYITVNNSSLDYLIPKFIYLREDDVFIANFEEYLDSNRKNKE